MTVLYEGLPGMIIGGVAVIALAFREQWSISTRPVWATLDDLDSLVGTQTLYLPIFLAERRSSTVCQLRLEKKASIYFGRSAGL